MSLPDVVSGLLLSSRSDVRIVSGTPNWLKENAPRGIVRRITYVKLILYSNLLTCHKFCKISIIVHQLIKRAVFDDFSFVDNDILSQFLIVESLYAITILVLFKQSSDSEIYFWVILSSALVASSNIKIFCFSNSTLTQSIPFRHPFFFCHTSLTNLQIKNIAYVQKDWQRAKTAVKL